MSVVSHRTHPDASVPDRDDVASSDVARGALLETKLYVPRSRAGLVARPRLLERMHAGADAKVTLVTAPAGSGKTTLVTEWLAQAAAAGRATGWVSLDASENEPALFWAYFVRALQKAHPGLGARAFMMLHSTEPSMRPILTALINEIDSIERDVAIVLDDYHVIDSPPIHDALAFLLDHMPAPLHLVIASRSEPPLPLARMRARGELTELRGADLRFTPTEASAFLNGVMSLDLSSSDVAKLEERTEGWIAGLKLAALSLEGRPEAARSLASFSGDQRYIAEYLVDEVIQREPDDVRRFLFRTSILGRLSGPLCDAVAVGDDSQALLESLFKRNLFVVALDDRREWYRYHHLFADVLQSHAARAAPDDVRDAHRRASAWHELHGTRSDAVRHAMAAGDEDRAADLLEREWPARDRSFEACRWLTRVKELPDRIVRARPVLSMAYAWALLNGGEIEAAPERLEDVQRWLDAAPDREAASAAGMVVADEERFASLRAELAAARVYHAQTVGDTAATVEHAKHALALVPPDDGARRATGTALLALALWANGELEAAHRTFALALDLMRGAGLARDAIRGIFVLGDIRVAQGRLQEAAQTYEDGLRAAADEGSTGLVEVDELYLGLSEVHRERGELDRADRLLAQIAEASRSALYTGNRQRWCTASAAVLEARGDLAGARRLLEEANGGFRRDPLPRARPVGARLARLAIREGRLEQAEQDLAALVPPDAANAGYLHEFAQVTRARLLLARAEGGTSTLEALMRQLHTLLAAAEAGGRAGSVIEILALQSLAIQRAGGGRRALEPLERSLGLARGEGYVGVFVDEGEPMRDLLRQAVARGVEPEYAGRLLLAFESPRSEAPPSADAGDDSVHRLTTREQAILRLIASGMRNQEIADQLFISPATVKRHIANVYGKLGVVHRTEALVVARRLGLL